MKKTLLMIALVSGMSAYGAESSTANFLDVLHNSEMWKTDSFNSYIEGHKPISRGDQQLLYATIVAYKHVKDQILERLKNGKFDDSDRKKLDEIKKVKRSTLGHLL